MNPESGTTPAAAPLPAWLVPMGRRLADDAEYQIGLLANLRMSATQALASFDPRAAIPADVFARAAEIPGSSRLDGAERAALEAWSAHVSGEVVAIRAANLASLEARERLEAERRASDEGQEARRREDAEDARWRSHEAREAAYASWRATDAARRDARESARWQAREAEEADYRAWKAKQVA